MMVSLNRWIKILTLNVMVTSFWGGGGGWGSGPQEKVINVQPGFFRLVINKTPSNHPGIERPGWK